MCISPVVFRNFIFLMFSLSFGTYTLSISSSTGFPIGFDGGDLFRTDIPKYFLSSYEYLFVVFLSVAEEGFSDDSKALI